MARSDPQVNVRIPDDLLQRLRDAADHSARSLSAEINFRLFASFISPTDAQATYNQALQLQRDMEQVILTQAANLDEIRRTEKRLADLTEEVEKLRMKVR